MELRQKGIARRRERHYRESRLVLGVALMMAGGLFLLILTFAWSQLLFPYIFNSRLLFRLIINKDSYASCSSQYQGFIQNSDPPEVALTSFYVFNVTNPAEVIQIGNRPHLQRLGPYAYSSQHFKYDVAFSDNSSTISYKQYSSLQSVKAGSTLCQRSFMQDAVSCEEPSSCICQDANDNVTIVNPLFAKALWMDGSDSIIAFMSQDYFTSIRDLLENE